MPIQKAGGKKDGKQRYRVRINYTDSNGKAHQIERVAYGLAEANDMEQRLLMETKKEPLSKKMTVQALYDEYIKVKQHEVRETTLRTSIQVIETHILLYFAKRYISKLTNSVLQEWKNQISEQGLSFQTKQNIYREFRTMLNYAVKMDYISKNPLTKVGNFRDPYFSKPEEKIQYYLPEQFKKYIKKAREYAEQDSTITGWGYYVFFCIAYYTGMRKGEINALKWSDIDGNIIHVRRSIAQKLKGGDKETPPKNKSSYRDLQAPIPLMKVLEEHRIRQKQSSNYSDNFRVCGGINCLRDSSIDNKNKLFAKAAELPRIRIHDFRHSHASLLANEGINIQEIARRLGHSKIEITWNTYSHLYPREEERAIEVLNKIE